MDLPSTKKSLGQHWLTDDATLDAIIGAAELNADDVVLEIGPGAGTLTEKLVKKASEVVAVEFDEDLAHELPARVPADNLKVIRRDILRFDLTSLPPGYKVVANIPYYLTSNLVRTLSESTNPPERVVLLIQKEVAERIAAQPGSMSLLTVTAQFFWKVSLSVVVPTKLFSPPPKVDSQVIVLERLPDTLFSDVDSKDFFRLVKAGFSARRKTIENSLSGGLALKKPDVNKLLIKANIPSTARPQTLSLQDWYRLYKSTR